MTDEKLKMANEINDEIKKVFEDLVLAKKDVTASYLGTYRFGMVSKDVNKILQTIVVAHLEDQVKKLQEEYEKL